MSARIAAKKIGGDMPSTALATVDPQQVLARFIAGEAIAEIATSLQTTHTRLYQSILATHPDLWREASAASALADLDSAAEAQERAEDGLSLARARARVDLAKWRLERLLRRYFGQDQSSNSGPGVQINVNIHPRTEQVIEVKESSTDK